MIDTREFVRQLKDKVYWDRVSKKHWSGSKIVTNQDMKIMCSHYFGKGYDTLSFKEQRLVRERIFRELRGKPND